MEIPDITKDKKAYDAYKNCNITLGTDLEVSLHSQDNPMVASSALQWWDGDVKHGKIGADGRTSFFQYLIELRPSPGYVCLDLVKNMTEIIEGEIKKHPELLLHHWKAGTGDFVTLPPSVASSGAGFLPKGGHIHFGNLPFHEDIVYAFDMLLAPINLLTENPIKAVFRRAFPYNFRGTTYYGQLGGYRHSQTYPTWEYRTLSNFCNNQFEMVAYFDIAKAIAHEVATNHEHFIATLNKKHKKLAVDIISFNCCLKEFFMPRLKTIFKILSGLSLLNNEYGQELLKKFYKYVANYDVFKYNNILETFGIFDKMTANKPKGPVKKASTENRRILEYLEQCVVNATANGVWNVVNQYYSQRNNQNPVINLPQGAVTSTMTTDYPVPATAGYIKEKFQIPHNNIINFIRSHIAVLANVVSDYQKKLSPPYGVTMEEWKQRAALAAKRIDFSSSETFSPTLIL